MRSSTPTRGARVRFSRFAGALGLLLASAVATAQDPKPPAAAGKAETHPDDPKAVALLGEVARAYQALGAYSDQGRFIVSMSVGDKAQKQESPLHLTLVRPNKLHLDAGPVQLVCDGETMTTTVASFKKYMRSPAPQAITMDAFREGPVGAVLFGAPSGVPMYILVNMLTGADPVKSIEQLGGSLKLVGDSTLLIDQDDGPDMKLTVDPATKLLQAIDLVIDPKLLEQSARQGNPVKVERLGWTAGEITTTAVDASRFAFQAPEGFTKVESFALPGGGLGERPKMAVESMVGRPAPDFALTLFDGPEKTRIATKKDLAGKVVVIDFWATWCGPCLVELPEIQKLVEQLAKDGKDVLIVALSQDRVPAEPAEVRKLIEKTLAEKKITLTAATAAIGLDPSASVGELFQVEALPTLVVLDGKGVVQAVHIGFSPDIREKLAAEIDALLAGKSLVPPEGEAKDAAAKPESPKN